MIYGLLATSPHSSITEDSVLEFAINSYYDFKMSAADAIMESAGYLLEADDEENKEDKKEEKKNDSSSSSSEDGFFAKLVAGIKKIFTSFWNAIKSLFEKITGLFKKKADTAASKDKAESAPSWYSEKCKFRNYLKVADDTEVSADPLTDVLGLMDELIDGINGNITPEKFAELEQKASESKDILRMNPFAKSYNNKMNDFNPRNPDDLNRIEDYIKDENIPEEETTYGDLNKMLNRDELVKRNKAISKERSELSKFEVDFNDRIDKLEKISKTNFGGNHQLKRAVKALKQISKTSSTILSCYAKAFGVKIRLNARMFKEIGRVTAEGKAQFEKTDDKDKK